MLVEPPKAGSQAACPFEIPPCFLPSILLTKANPSKGGDAKLRD
jgi:hypothetical protein